MWLVQTSFYGAHTLSLDAAAQTTSLSTLSQHVSTQMGSRPASSFSVDTSVQTPIRSAVLHDAAIQLPLTEFFIGCICSNSPLDRQNPVRQSPPPMQGSHALRQPPPGLEQPAPPLELAAHSHLVTTHGAYVNSSPSHAQQSPVSTTQVEHTLYAQLPAPKGVPVPPQREPITLLAASATSPISLLDVAVQTTPPCDAFQDVSTKTSDQPVSRYLSMWQCRRLATISTSHLWMLPYRTTPQSTPSQHVSTQMGSRSVSSFSVDIFVQTPIHSVVLHDVAIQLPFTEFFTGCICSNDPLDRQNFVRHTLSSIQGPRALLQPPPGLEQLAPPSGPAIGSHLHTTHGASTTAAPPRARLRSAVSVTPPQHLVCTTHV